jgi:hypothetical protein
MIPICDAKSQLIHHNSLEKHLADLSGEISIL